MVLVIAPQGNGQDKATLLGRPLSQRALGGLLAMPFFKIAVAALSTVGWAVLIARGTELIRADVMYGAGYADGLRDGSAA